MYEAGHDATPKVQADHHTRRTSRPRSSTIERGSQEAPARLEREMLLRKARQAETGSHISDWLRSPGLQPPE
jgi:hypothetical protein